MKKSISILGSTGSIGKTVFKIIDKKKIILKFTFYLLIKILRLFINKLKNTSQNIFIINDKKSFQKIKKNFQIKN